MNSTPLLRGFSTLSALLGCSSALAAPPARPAGAPRPNVILCMADDLGWGDTGFDGNTHLRTPNLDQMAREGVRFERFYAAAPVCSPTRGSCLTGRHPYRYGIYFANEGFLPRKEVTVAEELKDLGYVTGHFGKWHLGTLSRTIKDSNRGGRPDSTALYSPPWENGFDVCFSTESQIPDWDPMVNQSVAPTYYWTGEGKMAKDNLSGDDSRVIMDRVIPFIRQATQSHQPFLAVIWFHTPHAPTVAGPGYRAAYGDQDENHQHYYGAVTAMDEQVGRLRAELRTLGIAEDTMLWFASDNGPAAKGGGPGPAPGGHQQGVTGLLRGRKGSLHEGGIRVPGLLVWPGQIKHPEVIAEPCVTSDYLPTILSALAVSPAKFPANLDGENILPILAGEREHRERPIAFESQRQRALIDGRFKLYSADEGATWELYDLEQDPAEARNRAPLQQGRVRTMSLALEAWRRAVAAELPQPAVSLKGASPSEGASSLAKFGDD